MRENYVESAAASATRLRSKKITKCLAVSFAALALVVQMASGILPGESNSAMAQTGSEADHIVTGGFSSKQQMIDIYKANRDKGGHTDIQAIYNQYGVSLKDLENAQVATFNTNDFNGNLKVLGRVNHKVSNRFAVKVEKTGGTIYSGGWLDGYNNKKWTYKALIGKRIVDGKWFAVMFDCGNIVYNEPPVWPKDIQVCDIASKKIITIKENQYDSKKHSKNLDDCKEKPVVKDIQVCDLTTKKIVTIKENAFDSKKHSKNLDDCKEKPVVKDIQVCDLATKKVVTIKETAFDSKKHSKNLDDCKEKPVEKNIEVCDLTTKKIVTIKESAYDSKKYSKNLDDCKEQPVVKNIEVCDLETKEMTTIKETDFDATKHSKDAADCATTPVTPETPETPATPETPQELPQTGIADGLSGLFGIGSIVAAAGYYVSSRRNLLTTLLSR